MANTLQQRAQQRKLIYAALIMGLFTASLVHRTQAIEPQAERLQLRELVRGEVELTSSFLRHTLSGLHGFGVTMLWSAAIEKQKKHEWNEVELLVDSITKLQPYFITPWRFQGWNLAFNVAVECDRPVDKYYYITRGLTLLAHGERRNQGVQAEDGTVTFPGSPDLRRDVGFTYQLKMGTCDDKYTMRCLLDMSCIDPVQRRFPTTGLSDREISPELQTKLENFCREHPTLSRRIVEKVFKSTPKAFVEFLEDNKDVPSRFDASRYDAAPDAKFTKLKDPTEQFPVLPVVKRPDPDWPDAREARLTGEVISVYLMSRTWFQYAQQPLPEPENYYKIIVTHEKPAIFDRTKHRLPGMADVIFRSDPARAQAFMAETLEEEGWFDHEGWDVEEVAKSLLPRVKQPIGTGISAKPVWTRAYAMYKKFGEDTGLYLNDAQTAQLEELASKFRDEYNLKPGDNPPTSLPQKLWDDHYYAHLALRANVQRRSMTNFDAHLFTAEAESSSDTLYGRRSFFKALYAWDHGSRIEYFAEMEQAIDIWMYVMLKYPKFCQVRTNQEDTYERQLKFMTRSQEYRELEKGVIAREFFTNCLLGTWDLAPPIPWAVYPGLRIPWSYNPKTGKAEELAKTKPGVAKAGETTVARRFLTPEQIKNIVPLRMRIRGPFDSTMYYDSSLTPRVKDALLLWTAGASLSGNPLECLPAGLMPGRRTLLLTRVAPLGEFAVPRVTIWKDPPPLGDPRRGAWRYVVDPESVSVTRSRLDLRDR